jgi:itaconyl-CoA hydratase
MVSGEKNKVRTIGYNQDGKIVIEFHRTVFVYKRGQGPKIARLAPQDGK